jgi:hypothetical protein
MKQDSDWLTVNTSFDPLALYRLIEKTTLAQTEDQYPFATVYAQELAFYSFKQDSLTNPQWYARFNTKVDVGAAIGITRQHKVLLEYVAMELHQQAFDTSGAAEQQAVRDDAEERYISFAFLFQSGQNHANLKRASRMVSPRATTATPRIVSRLSICWTTTARSLRSSRLQLRDRHLRKRATKVTETKATKTKATKVTKIKATKGTELERVKESHSPTRTTPRIPMPTMTTMTSPDPAMPKSPSRSLRL